ncbi:hypothetical protein NA78x_001748 [Anatilimnocola sp. NA78]|uniref:hypothetical protein n=1 Tax=Anatilimnocola sp. NA78 TaxID=3415683 RepID=UPI003CE51C6F
MASHLFNEWKQQLLRDYLASSDDIRLIGVMSNTTADTDNDDIVYVGDIGTLDEFNGANYSRPALASEVVNEDDTGDEAEFDAADVTLTALGAGTRSLAGWVMYRHVTNDADSPVIGYLEYATPKTPDGSDFVVQWNAEGLIKAG